MDRERHQRQEQEGDSAKEYGSFEFHWPHPTVVQNDSFERS